MNRRPPTNKPARRLRATMAAVRVSFTWFGVRKTLTPEQKAQAADTFGAEGQFLSAGKKLLDTRHPAFKAVTRRPRPDPQLLEGHQLALSRAGHPADPAGRHRRLQRADDDAQGRAGRSRRAARRALRRTAGPRPESGWAGCSTPADYPESLAACLPSSWDFPSVEPPDYLRQLSPELYGRRASGCRPGSRRPCGWPSRRSPTNWPSWSRT